MQFRKWSFLAILGAVAFTARPMILGEQPQQQQTQVPIFRSAVTLVPIDVRVTDKSGKPVTDLKQDEFAITEDGVKQDIRHISVQMLTAQKVEADTNLVLRETAINLEPQTNRIFLIVLGRGKLQEPSRAVDALIRFVRERLLPQDQVAVFAYNRATTFTRDHRQIATLLDRFRQMHEQVDFEIGLQMSGLAAVYGSKLIPRSLQGKIDQMFAGSGLLAVRRQLHVQHLRADIHLDLRQPNAKIGPRVGIVYPFHDGDEKIHVRSHVGSDRQLVDRAVAG
jgi:VWFA-related protein